MPAKTGWERSASHRSQPPFPRPGKCPHDPNTRSTDDRTSGCIETANPCTQRWFHSRKIARRSGRSHHRSSPPVPSAAHAPPASHARWHQPAPSRPGTPGAGGGGDAVPPGERASTIPRPPATGAASEPIISIPPPSASPRHASDRNPPTPGDTSPTPASAPMDRAWHSKACPEADAPPRHLPWPPAAAESAAPAERCDPAASRPRSASACPPKPTTSPSKHPVLDGSLQINLSPSTIYKKRTFLFAQNRTFLFAHDNAASSPGVMSGSSVPCRPQTPWCGGWIRTPSPP